MSRWFDNLRADLAHRWRSVRTSPYGFAIPWLVALCALLGVLAVWHVKPSQYDPPTLQDQGIVVVTNNSARTYIWSPDYDGPYPSVHEESGYRVSAGATMRIMNFDGMWTRMRLIDPITCQASAETAMTSSGYATISADGKLSFRSAQNSDMGPLPTDYQLTAEVCSGRARGESPALSHEGTLFALGDDQIWKLSPDGGAARFMPNDAVIVAAHPTADGRIVVTQTTNLNGSGVGSVWIADPASGTAIEFKDHAGGGVPSPDGRWIAYQAQSAGGMYQLHVARLDGSDDRSLIANATDFVWSPDSTALAVAIHPDPKLDDQVLDIVDLDGTTRQLVTGVGMDSGLDWSHDGKRIVVGLGGSGDQEYETTTLLIIGPDGTELGRIAVGSDPLGYAAFSPDSTRLAFLRITYPLANSAEVDDVFVASADGFGPRVVESWSFSGQPIWAPSSNALAIERMEDTGPAQLTLAFLDGSPRQVVAEAMGPVFWLP